MHSNAQANSVATAIAVAELYASFFSSNGVDRRLPFTPLILVRTYNFTNAKISLYVIQNDLELQSS
jgi:hypothetical protein